MFFALNLTLFSLTTAQFSITRPNTRFSSFLESSKVQIRNNFYPFLSVFSKNTENINVIQSSFCNFLSSVVKIDQTVFNRDDISIRPLTNLDDPNVTVTESFFANCSSYDGGALFVILDGPIIVQKSNFVNCSADNKGGVVFFYGQSLSITDTCFSNCMANQGFAIFCSRTTAQTDVENCHFYQLNGELSAVFLDGFDLKISNNNMTNVQANEVSGIATYYLKPSHSFSFESISISQCSGNYLINLISLDSADTINRGNAIDCTLGASGSIFLLDSCNLILNNWAFSFSADTSNLVFATGQSSTAEIQNSYFSLQRNQITFETFVTVQSTVQFGNSSLINIDYLNTHECWHQNRYKFLEPALYKKIIVAVLVALIFAAAFIYIIVMACKDEKLHKQLQSKTEMNEQLNNQIQASDIKTLAEEKKEKDELVTMGLDGEGDISD